MSNYNVQLTGAAQSDYIAQRFNKNSQPDVEITGIVQHLDLYGFRRAFVDENRGSQFSYEALTALYEWLEEIADNTAYELDVIALCCEFTEYSDFGEVYDAYSGTGIETLADLRDHTTVIEFDGGLIIQDF